MLETDPFKKKSFHRKIIACIIVVLSIHLIIISPYEEAKAITPTKIMSFVTKKQAKKSISFLVQAKGKETVKDVVSKATKVPQERLKSKAYARNVSPRSPRKGMTRYEWQQSRQGKTTTKTYDIKEPDKWTDADIKKLDDAVENNIQKRLNNGNEWTLLDHIGDFFLDWSFIAMGVHYAYIKITSKEEQELERLTYDSLVEAQLLVPVFDTTNAGHAYVGSSGSFGEQPSWYEIDAPVEGEEGSEGTTKPRLGFTFAPADLNLVQENGMEVDQEVTTETAFEFRNYSGNENQIRFTSSTQHINFNPTGRSILGATVVINFNNYVGFDNSYNVSYTMYNQQTWSNYLYFGHSVGNSYGEGTMYFNSNDFGFSRFDSDLIYSFNGQPSTYDGNAFWNEQSEVFASPERLIINFPKTPGDDMILVLQNQQDQASVRRHIDMLPTDWNVTHLQFEFTGMFLPSVYPNFDVNTYWTNAPNITRDFEQIPNYDDIEVKPSELEDINKKTITLPTPNAIPVNVPGHDEEFYVTPTDDGELTLKGKDTGTIPNINEEDEPELEVGMPVPNPLPSSPPPEIERPPEPTPNPPGEGGGSEGGGGEGEGEEAPSCVVNRDFDGFKELGETFTTKFPFSIPFDIYRLFEAVFGEMGSERPEFVYPVGNTEFEIGIPAYFDKWMPFARSMLLIIFDIGLIYAVRKMMGGNQG